MPSSDRPARSSAWTITTRRASLTANRPGAHTARATLSYLWNQIENGVGCPTGMAYSSIPSLRRVTAIRDHWEDKVLAEGYDARPIPVTEKSAATIGMALTEKQGGSDLRANATRAIAVNGGDRLPHARGVGVAPRHVA